MAAPTEAASCPMPGASVTMRPCRWRLTERSSNRLPLSITRYPSSASSSLIGRSETRSSPSSSRYLTIGGKEADATPSRLTRAAGAASFILAGWSDRLAAVALDDHLLRLVFAGEDAQDGVAGKLHPIVLAIPIGSAVLQGVELHLALQAPHEMRKCVRGRVGGLRRQRHELRRRGQAVAVAVRFQVLQAQRVAHAMLVEPDHLLAGQLHQLRSPSRFLGDIPILELDRVL